MTRGRSWQGGVANLPVGIVDEGVVAVGEGGGAQRPAPEAPAGVPVDLVLLGVRQATGRLWEDNEAVRRGGKCKKKGKAV